MGVDPGVSSLVLGNISSNSMTFGGGSGIRTHGTVSRTHAFQASALSHSAIPPYKNARDYTAGGRRNKRSGCAVRAHGLVLGRTEIPHGTIFSALHRFVAACGRLRVAGDRRQPL